MSPIRDKINKTKKVRRPLTVAQKLEVIAKLEGGVRSKDICTAMKLSSSTVRTIVLQKEKLTNVAQECINGMYSERITRTRGSLMEKMEKLLIHWIDSNNQQNLNFLIIQEKALSFFKTLKEKAEEEGTVNVKEMDFKASHGWFERFKRRANLHKMRVTGDKNSSNIELAKTLPKVCEKIEEKKQNFNTDETGLFSKRLACQTLISVDENKAPGFKISQDHLTLLGGILNGDVKLNPLLLYHSENPRTHSIGFNAIDQSNVHKLLAPHSENLTDKELSENSKEKRDNIEENSESVKTLDAKTLSVFFKTCDKAIKIVEDNDPQIERISAFKQKIEEAVACYRDLFTTLKPAAQQSYLQSKKNIDQPSTSAASPLVYID